MLFLALYQYFPVETMAIVASLGYAEGLRWILYTEAFRNGHHYLTLNNLYSSYLR